MTALRAEGCGIALTGDEHKVSVTGLAFYVIWYDKHSADWLAALAPLSGLRRTSPAVRSVNRKEGPFMDRLRAYFDRLAHPMQDVHRGRIKHLEASLRKRLYSKHGLLCHLEEGGGTGTGFIGELCDLRIQ